MASKPQPKLLQALSFVGNSGATECKFNEGFVFSEHKGIHLCHPVDEHLSLTAPIKQLQKAIKTMGDCLALTELADALQIKNDDFSMTLGRASETPTPIFEAGETFEGDCATLISDLVSLAKIPDLSGEVSLTSIRSTGQTLVSTNRKILLEVWHGQGFPQCNLPGAAIRTLAKIKAACTGIMWTAQQMVFRFGDAVLSFPFVPGEWMEYEQFFNLEPADDGAELKAALIQVLPFCENSVSFEDSDIVARTDKAVVRRSVTERVGTCEYFAKEMEYFVKHGEVYGNNEEKFAFQGGKYRGVVSFVPKEN